MTSTTPAMDDLMPVGDFQSLRQRILDQSLEAVRSRFPMENDQYILSLEDLGYESLEGFDKLAQKRAIQTDGSLSARLKGRWVMTNKTTGEVLRGNKRGIMDVPWLTERGTFIRSGSEVTLPIQMRLVPGVYARIGEDGTARAHINARQGTGNSASMTLDPANPVFRVSVGTRNYKLYPLLKHLGVDDRELKKAWGDEIWRANYDDFVSGGGWYSRKTSDGAPGSEVDGATGSHYDDIAKDVLGGELDPINTRMTFGQEYNKVDGPLLAATSLRLLQLTKGEIEQDNRDSLENQRFFMAPELISERIRLDAGGLARNLLWKATKAGTPDKIPGGALTRYIHGLFTESDLAQVIEETNPLDAYSRATKVTRMGEGGISSIDSAPMSSRMVHNTYKGFIDPVSTPESLRVGLDTQIAVGARMGRDGLMYAPFIDGATGKRVMVNSIEASTVPVAFPEYRDSRDRLIPAMIGNRIEYLPRKDVKYFVPSGDDLYALASNFVPLKSGIKAGRLLMAQKHQTQAMSLPKRQAPYVQTLDPNGDGQSVEQRYGEMLGAVRSATDGVVIKATPDTIVVKPVSGPVKTYSLYNYHPLNRKTMITNMARVKQGDRVTAGQILASSNYTDDDGTAALGIQLTTAWLPYEGYNYLDGIVISESAAKKLSSEHLYHLTKEKEKGLTFDREAFVGTFPTKYTRDQISRLDEQGVVRPGTILQKGDPMILALSKMPPTAGSMFRALSKDASETWEHEFPGEVVDVVSTDNLTKVYTKAIVPAAVGDKLACYDDRTEVLTATGWKKFSDLALTDRVATLDPSTGVFSYLFPTRLIQYTYAGPILRTHTDALDLAVTPNHRMWVSDSAGPSRFELRQASDCRGHKVYHTKTASWIGAPTPGEIKLTFPCRDEMRVPVDVYLECLACSMCRHYTPAQKHPRSVSQATADWLHRHRVGAYDPDIDQIDYSDTMVGLHFTGMAYFPAWVFDLGQSEVRHLVAGLMGMTTRGLVTRGITATVQSAYYADALQRLCLHAGMAADIDKKGDHYRLRLYTPAAAAKVPSRKWYRHTESAELYNGSVWCCEMPRHGVIYVRRNGKGVWCGNCRFANKGTVGRIVPDDQMPRTRDGKAIDVAFSPTGIPSRVNSAQLIEAALGKVAEKTGKRYVLPGFQSDNLAEFALKELADAGLSAKEDLIDPKTGLTIPQVMVGNSYVTKFHHTSESKASARSTGGYTSDEQPATGGHDGAKTLGGLVLGAFVAHDSTGMMKDLKQIKGQKNTDFWRDFKMGRTPAAPGTPLIYERFLAHLEGSGVHVNKEGAETNIFALTDKDIREYARNPLENAGTYDASTLRPLPGGLFDPAVFGPDGDQWGRIDLDDPIPNPVMEDTLRGLLGLTAAQFDAVLSGERKLPNGQTGGEGLLAQLKSIDVDREIAAARATIVNGSKSKRDKAVKNYRWLQAMKKHGAHPADFMLTAVPVLPPRFRRVTQAGGMNMVADANYLYRALMDARNDAREAKAAGLPDDMVGMGRLGVYNAFKAVTGLGDPQDRQLQEKGISGLLTWVFGKGSPKCHDDETDILTERGFIPLKDYDGSFPCAWVDISGGKEDIRMGLPGKVRHIRHLGQMIRFAGPGLDLLVTPNHRCLATWSATADVRRYQMVDALRLYESRTPFYMLTAWESADDGGPRLVRPSEVSMEEFDGTVHSVTVPSGITVVRRKGVIAITGNSGKFQRSVVGGTLDVAGRSVINVDPELKLDEVGLPREQAWKLYQDFVVRRMVQNGSTVLQAAKEVAERSRTAAETLEKVVSERPLVITRAPALHKYSVMAFRPKLVDGDSLLLNAVVEKPFNADLDGDQQIGVVKVLIQPEILFSDENKAKASTDDSLYNLEWMLHYLLKREDRLSKKGVFTMYDKNTSVLMELAGEEKSVVTEVDLEDFPRGGLVATGVGTDKNIDIYEGLPGIKVQAYDEALGRFVWADVKYWTRHTGCAVEVVRLTGGHEIYTDNDPRAVYGIPTDSRDLSFCRFTPSEALSRKVMVPVGALSERSEDEGPGWISVETGVIHNRRPDNEIALPLDFETGQFLGIMAGDGWWDKRDQPGFVSFGGDGRAVYLADLDGYNDRVVRSVITKYVDPLMQAVRKEMLKDDYEDRYGDTVRYSYYFNGGTAMCKFLSSCLGGERTETSAGSASKKLPNWLWGCSSGFRRGVLCGLIATDGSIRTNRAKGKDRLIISFGSTSLRLCREVKRLCRSLGISSSILYSKETVRGNGFWMVCLSSVDCKRTNVFAGMAHARKAETFKAIDVSFKRQHVRGRWVVYPAGVSDVVHRWIKRPNIESAARSTDSPEVLRRRRLQSLFTSLYAARRKGYVTVGLAEAVIARAAEMDQDRQMAIETMRKWQARVLSNNAAPMDREVAGELTFALDTFKEQLPLPLYQKTRALISRRANMGKACSNMAVLLSEVLGKHLEVCYGLSQEPLFQKWCLLVKSGHLWEMVEKVDKTGKIETGYDLCVPGYETFVSSDGVVLSNTMTYYVPVSDRAVKEAYAKMLPSKNLLSARDYKAHYLPQEEISLGVFLASRDGKGPVKRVFNTRQDAILAYKRGEIDLNDNIQVLKD